MSEPYDHSSRVLRPPRLKKTTSFKARGNKQDIHTSPPIIKTYLANDKDEQHNFSTCNRAAFLSPTCALAQGSASTPAPTQVETVPAPAVEMERGKVGKEDTKR
jgi:hypothetical protein